MRLLQLSVPDDRREAVLDVLREGEFGYVTSEGTADQADRTNVAVVVPADAVEHVLEDLEDAGVDREAFTASIETEFATYAGVDEVQERWGRTPNRLAPDALRSKAKDLRRNTRSYVWMMALSAVVATAGLFMDTPAVVVGSMVIAPIVSPVLTADVGVVRNDRDMVIRSVHAQALGLAVAIATAAATTWLFAQFHVVSGSQAIEAMELVSIRIAPSLLALVVALAAGAAGTYGLATKGQVTIVGVMIAAALIPTAATVGIGVAWANPVVTLGALLLLVVSVLGVNVGGAAMLFYLDYRPGDVAEGLLTFDDPKRVFVVAATVLLVVAVVSIAGVTFAQQSAFERSVNDATTDVLEEDPYGTLGVQSVTIEYTTPAVSDRTVVTFALTRTADRSYPDLPDRLARAITERTDRDVVVRVRFVDYHRSGPSTAG